MISQLIPPFDIQQVLIVPWRDDGMGCLWIVLMGFLVVLACGLVGQFMVVRRMALVGDAIAHSLLPGIALGFLITASRAPFVMAVSAILVGVLTALLIEWIPKRSRVKPDAALGIVFSTLFAIGVILMTVFADKVDLDADCVLYGEIGFVAMEAPFKVAGLSLLVPAPVVRMAGLTLLLVLMIIVFYKELLVTSFDPGLAKSLGISITVFHYGLMVALSLTIVSAFESVGAILVIAMLIFPGVTASLLTNRMPLILGMTALLAGLYAIGGFHLAVWWDCSIAGAMVVTAGFFFALVWVLNTRCGLLWQILQRVKRSASIS